MMVLRLTLPLSMPDSPMLESTDTDIPMLMLPLFPMLSNLFSGRLMSLPPTFQFLLPLEDTRLKPETTEILPELFMRFPDFSQLPLSSSRKTPTEVHSLSEPALLSPTLLSRGRLKPIPTFFTELPTTHTLMDTLPMDTLPMDGLTMDRHLESGV